MSSPSCATRSSLPSAATAAWWSLHARPQGRRGKLGEQGDPRSENSAPAFWLHVDLDVLRTNDFPAADYTQPGGLAWDELLEIARRALAAPDCLGCSIVIYYRTSIPRTRPPRESCASPATSSARGRPEHDDRHGRMHSLRRAATTIEGGVAARSFQRARYDAREGQSGGWRRPLRQGIRASWRVCTDVPARPERSSERRRSRRLPFPQSRNALAARVCQLSTGVVSGAAVANKFAYGLPSA
jgi:hypothetical protein